MSPSLGFSLSHPSIHSFVRSLAHSLAVSNLSSLTVSFFTARYFMMAPLGQRLLLVFGLVAGFLSSLGLARIIDRDLVWSTDLLNVLP